MTEDPKLRRRRRRSAQTLEQPPSLPTINPKSDSPLLKDETNSISESTTDDLDPSSDFILTIDQISSPPLINTIDQISTELGEDRRDNTDSEYWDDTHDWGREYNSDYWGFLGRYE